MKIKKQKKNFTIKMPSLMNVSPQAIIRTGWMGWKSPRARGLLTTPSVLPGIEGADQEDGSSELCRYAML